MRNRNYWKTLGCALIVSLAASHAARAAVVVLEPFATDEGRFKGVPTASGTSTGFVTAGTTLTFDAVEGHTDAGSQKFVVDDDPAVNISTTFLWRIRDLSGSPTSNGNPANNVTLTADGYIGFWVKTTTPGLQASIVIDDGAESVNERGAYRNIIADGQWHAYEWNFDAAASTDWFNFNAGTNVVSSTTVTVDSIYILAPGASPAELDATLWVDDLSYNTEGSIVPEPAGLSVAGLGLLALAKRRRK
jgi:hypothetical protein